MDVYIQKCQQCGSRNLRNVLARDDAQRVYVQCRDCQSLVARYVIAPGGYFHAGKDYESFLRAMMLDSGFSSGRDLNAVFQEVAESSQSGFEDAIACAQKKYGEELP
jgi:DNA-directed RNA polymerase subunit RPC12/RpoP